MVEFRSTEESDLSWVMALERSPDVSPFITPWSIEEHEEARMSPDWAHLMLVRSGSEEPLGFALVADFRTAEPCLHRLAVARQGEGTGREALRRIKALAFGSWGARRLWLDVFDFNERAFGLYRSEGFEQIGIRPGVEVGGAPDSTLYLMQVTPERAEEGRG